MANGYSPKDIKLDGLAAISGVVSNQAVSKDTGLTWAGATHLRVDLKVSGVTVVGSITAKLQHRAPNGSFEDLAGANASVTISADGIVTITQLIERAADQANMPIRKQIQVVITTTNAGDEVTVDNIWIYQGL